MVGRWNGLRVIWVVALLALGPGWGSITLAATPLSVARQKDPALVLAIQHRPRAFAALAERATADNRVRVIVRLNTRFQAEAELSAAAQIDQHAAIRRADEALRSQLGVTADAYEGLERLPYVIVSVNAEGLARLSRSAQVAGVEEDLPEPVQLGDSGALIGASGAFGAHGLGYTGAGHAVAILDTGVDRQHPFLDGRVVAEACFSTTYSGAYTSTTVCPNGTSEQIGTDAAQPCNVSNPDPAGSCAHGTHVAGIAAGSAYGAMTTDGASAPFDGIAPGATIIAVQVFSRFDSETTCGGAAVTPCYLTYSSDQIRAFNWLTGVAATYNLAAINMSLGGTTKYTTNCDVDARKTGIDTLRAAGVVTFIASGNSGYTNGLGAPACISTAVSVGSVRDGGPSATPADSVSTFSNSASYLSVLAPGEWIESSVPGDAFSIWRGTSMAAPHVAGAWLVLREMYPSETTDQLLTRMLNDGVPVTDSRNSITRPRIELVAPTATSTPTATATTAAMATYTSSPTATLTATTTPTATLTGTATPTATSVVSSTSTATGEATTTETATAPPTPTASSVSSPTPSVTPSATVQATETPTSAPTPVLPFAVFVPELHR